MREFPPPYTLALEEVETPRDLWKRFLAIGRERLPILLDSGGDVEQARYSILVHSPVAVHSVRVEHLSGLGRRACREGLFGPLEMPSQPDLGGREGRDLPFLGGWIGAIDYEVGDYVAARPIAPRPLRRRNPRRELLWFGFYPSGWIRDRRAGRTWRFALRSDRAGTAGGVSPRRTATALAGGLRGSAALPGRDSYERAVRGALELIRAGEIYQVDLSQRVIDLAVEDELALYGRLRELSPAPYGACMCLPGRTILANSPELFFQLRDDELVTMPIKGTRARVRADAQRDRAALRELERSDKDRAELLMIVDLYRNDVGRLALPGTVDVPGGLRSASFSNVHHLLAEVRGRLPAGTSPAQVLGALYPAGSISGAPKLRAQEVIAELENEDRGIYTGSIGMLDVRNRATFNVAIRTAQWRLGRLALRMGAGIVADSDPAAEYGEILVKASAWMEALGVMAGGALAT